MYHAAPATGRHLLWLSSLRWNFERPPSEEAQKYFGRTGPSGEALSGGDRPLGWGNPMIGCLASYAFGSMRDPADVKSGLGVRGLEEGLRPFEALAASGRYIVLHHRAGDVAFDNRSSDRRTEEELSVVVPLAALAIQAARARWAPDAPDRIRTLVLSDSVGFHDALLRHVATSGEDLGLLPTNMADVVHTARDFPTWSLPAHHEAASDEALLAGRWRAVADWSAMAASGAVIATGQSSFRTTAVAVGNVPHCRISSTGEAAWPRC